MAAATVTCPKAGESQSRAGDGERYRRGRKAQLRIDLKVSWTSHQDTGEFKVSVRLHRDVSVDVPSS
jgi:hypothetical protein